MMRIKNTTFSVMHYYHVFPSAQVLVIKLL